MPNPNLERQSLLSDRSVVKVKRVKKVVHKKEKTIYKDVKDIHYCRRAVLREFNFYEYTKRNNDKE